jgi:hypothetical protein
MIWIGRLHRDSAADRLHVEDWYLVSENDGSRCEEYCEPNAPLKNSAHAIPRQIVPTDRSASPDGGPTARTGKPPAAAGQHSRFGGMEVELISLRRRGPRVARSAGVSATSAPALARQGLFVLLTPRVACEGQGAVCTGHVAQLLPVQEVARLSPLKHRPNSVFYSPLIFRSVLTEVWGALAYSEPYSCTSGGSVMKEDTSHDVIRAGKNASVGLKAMQVALQDAEAITARMQHNEFAGRVLELAKKKDLKGLGELLKSAASKSEVKVKSVEDFRIEVIMLVDGKQYYVCIGDGCHHHSGKTSPVVFEES